MRKLILTLIISTVCSSSQAQLLIPIAAPGGGETGQFVSSSLNNSNDVIFYTAGVSNSAYEYTYSNGSYTNLGNRGGQNTLPIAINNNGVIVGIATNSQGVYSGFQYSNGTIGALPVAGITQPAAISDAGQIVGNYVGTSSNGFFYSNGVTSNLGFNPTGISNNGNEIVGNISTGGIIYNVAGGSTIIGSLPGATTNGNAQTVNDSGSVVGTAYTATNQQHGFLYTSGQIEDLGTLGGTFSSAVGINDAGQVVGYSLDASGVDEAFIYSSATGMQSLNTLYSSLLVSGTGSQTGFTSLEGALDINESGAIAGVGFYYNGTTTVQENFLLIPESVPEPGSTALFVFGGLLILARHFHRSSKSKT